MASTASDILVDVLVDWGVDTIFGMPGDGINGIVEALRRRQDEIRFIQVRHEEAAAFAACGYAKFTGRLGVCIATSGPGGLHLLNGLYDAKLDHQPVLAITGLQYHDLVGTYTQQDVELDKVFQDVALYNQRIMGAAHVRNIANLACRTALAHRGVSHITIPVDLQEQGIGADMRAPRNVKGHNTALFAPQLPVPSEAQTRRAVEILDAGKRVVILAGQGALRATDQLERLADKLGAVIVKALLGKAAVPDDSPFTTGQVGLLGTAPSQEALETCDTLLIAGSTFPYIEYYPKPGQARAIQIDIDAARIGLRYPVEAGLVGDCGLALDILTERVRRHEDRSFLKTAQAGKAEWMTLMEERGTRPDLPMKPQVVAWELGKRLSDTAIVACDSGTIATWWARQIPARRGQMHSLSGNLATMAPGVPYAIAAQLAHPGRQVVAYVGDGGFSMLMADFATAVKYKLPIKVIINNNNSLGQIKWEQIAMLGNPEYVCDLQPIDFAKVAEACGGRGFTITDPKDCGATLDAALAHPGPVVVDCLVDTNEPPMPPKVQAKQALHFTEALARGTPDALKIAATVFKGRAREVI
ncbi:pyruvate oxidase [Azospirillum brasilense]|uniref:Pyruvate oxidase n=1 Tax=Azospirillum brasilense TaxID=192 RepID=A0A0P0F6Q1_AZOBR|nr:MULTISPECIES: thiamine pyrophosphate-dependent enzyme [Azospirillum]ALJ38999.1 pyruvate oxidase [Azospirillum brasilense]MDW7557294.1 thiamine pyrophosphate-binding protein [Azospirillum brasilense]MDW7596296.1 thiamine pyrophosphate-binding protein [Azospirillum brasilense]MDW7631753.1 thiamine pyrophosphate-binding protein [Azospirillum brasilense]MDX5950593.1 thiamine pyrophosphate-binding protein [Azospirillum brasilense]